MAEEDDPLDRLDYYKLLGVALDASTDDIKRAFHLFAQRFHPDMHSGDTRAERAEAIYRRGTEAYRVLTVSEARKRYDEQLKQGRVRHDPSDTGPRKVVAARTGTLQVSSAKARPFFMKAVEALKTNNYAQAKLNLRMCLQHEPDNESIKAKLAEIESLAKK